MPMAAQAVRAATAGIAWLHQHHRRRIWWRGISCFYQRSRHGRWRWRGYNQQRDLLRLQHGHRHLYSQRQWQWNLQHRRHRRRNNHRSRRFRRRLRHHHRQRPEHPQHSPTTARAAAEPAAPSSSLPTAAIFRVLRSPPMAATQATPGRFRLPVASPASATAPAAVVVAALSF